MTIIQKAVAKLEESSNESARLDAQLLIAHVLGCSREDILINPPVLNAEQQTQFEALIARRANREPMSHLLGVREFYGRDFKVTRDVLDPRPDTEILIEVALANRFSLAPSASGGGINILDLGTGSGCIILTLLAELPVSKGMAVDISAAALEVAKTNAKNLGVADRITFMQADMADISEGSYDLIVSNPPYIASNEIPALMPEVAVFEPRLALDGGKDGLDYYRILAKTTPKLLGPEGLVLCEIGETQAADVAEIFNATGFKLRSVTKDLAGRDRCVAFKHNKLEQSVGI